MSATARCRLWMLAATLSIIALVVASTAHGSLGTSPATAAKIVLGQLLPGMLWMSDGSIPLPKTKPSGTPACPVFYLLSWPGLRSRSLASSCR